jgi:hypothetical protein
MMTMQPHQEMIWAYSYSHVGGATMFFYCSHITLVDSINIGQEQDH